MDKILYINSCTRECSRTDELSRHLISCLQGEAEELKLYEENLKPLSAEMIEKRDAFVKAGNTDDQYFKYAKKFAEADIIVISAPFWDLLFPAVLRAYLEAVCVCGITFHYSDKGFPVGMCKGKKLYYVTTAGGFIGENNFGFSYVKTLSQKMLGISEVQCFTAEGLDIYGADVEAIMASAKEKIKNELKKRHSP